MKIKTDYVPEHSKWYLTEGKIYEARRDSPGSDLVHIMADDGQMESVLLSGSYHLADSPLNLRPWTIVEE